MGIDLEHFERSLNALPQARVVMDKARACLEAWPDLYLLARTTAAAYLLQHTGKAMDPDRVWWHAFDDAVSGPTFTGWRHGEQPLQSLTFTALLVHRFSDGFQLAPDALPVYSGFYSQGAGASDYGQRNEVRLDVSKVMGDFWALDFTSLLSQRTAMFWREHSDDFTLLAKVRFIALLEEGFRQGALTLTDRSRLRRWLGLGAGEVTLALLQAASGRDDFHIRHYVITGGGHVVTLRAIDGRTVLYCPGTDWVPRGFANFGDLAHWLSQQLRQPQVFDALYRTSQQSSPTQRQQALDGLLKRLGPTAAPAWPFGVGRAVAGDLFVELRDWAKADLAVSHTLAISNADLRKTLWRGYLGAFLNVFGAFATMAWPLGLIMLGAGVARLALDVDAALGARTASDRTQAIFSAVADAVVSVFSLIDLGLGARALSFRAPPHERLAAPHSWQPTSRLDHELESLDGNRILPPANTTPGLLDGVSVDTDGSTWIEMDDLELRVRYSPETEGWLAEDDEDPFAFLPDYGLRIVEGRTWTLVEVAQPAEASTGEVARIASQFWDTYMKESPELSTQLSATLLDRQRRVLSQAGVPKPSAANPLLSTPEHFRYLMKEGKPWFTWIEESDLHNDFILAYTHEMTQANNLLRHGKNGDAGLLVYLNGLFDSLEQLPVSGAVRLWRGGSAQRATGGAHFRNGELNPGDVLVTTDITSFTENPYALREFVAPRQTRGLDSVHVFDDASVVYELIGKGLHSGIPIGPLSLMTNEAEVIFTPGRFLRIESVRDVRGAHYRFIKVRLREVDKPDAGPVFDLRTGVPFDRQAYVERVGHEPLVERFFPADDWP